MNGVKIKGKGKGSRRAERPYHHGDLRHALLRVAEQIILERGVDGFTLREAARRAGVSPAAPMHHFADAKGLLTEVAAQGFRAFGQALQEADEAAGPDPARRLRAQASAYVRFALEQPASFMLMFREDKHDRRNTEFVQAAAHAYSVLERAIRASTATPEGAPLSPQAQGLLTATWSIVHGFSHLALGGQLDPGKAGKIDHEMLLHVLLPRALEHLPWVREPPA